MGLHTGEPAVGDEGYIGMDVVRAARICSAGHGGQILLSETTRALVGGDLPEGVSIRDLGEQHLKDVRAEHLYQLDVGGSPQYFPMLRTDRTTTADDLGARISQHVESIVEAQLESVFAGGKPPTAKLAGLTAIGLTTAVRRDRRPRRDRVPDQGGVLLDDVRSARRRPRRGRHHLVRRADLHAAARRARRGRDQGRAAGRGRGAPLGAAVRRRARHALRRRELREALGRPRPAARDRRRAQARRRRRRVHPEPAAGARRRARPRRRGAPRPEAGARPLHDLLVRSRGPEGDAARLRPAAPGRRRPDLGDRRAGPRRRADRRLADRPHDRDVRGVRDPRRRARGRRRDARRLALGDRAVVRLLPPDRHARDREGSDRPGDGASTPSPPTRCFAPTRAA